MRPHPLLAGLMALVCAHCAAPAYANTTTANLGLNKPAVGADADVWGAYLNANADLLDAELSRTSQGDAAYAISAANRYVALTAALTAPRTWTLPAAGALKTGQAIVVIDEAAGISAANTLTLARSGSDTINGGASFVLNAARSVAVLRSDGASKWTVAGVPTAGTWTPTISFATPGTSSIAYSTQIGRYTRVGDLVYLDFQIIFTPTLGTASGALLIGGLPFAAASAGPQAGMVGSVGSNLSWTAGSFLVLIFQDPTHLTLTQIPGNAYILPGNCTNAASHTLAGSIAYKAS